MKRLVYTLIVFVIPFAVTSFTFMSANPCLWGANNRFITLSLALSFAIMVICYKGKLD